MEDPDTEEGQDTEELCSLGLDAVLLVDAKNGFNELSRKAMIWIARHRWEKGERFAFN